MAGSVLNDAIARFENNLGSVVQFHDHFAEDDNVEVYRVRGVHARMIRLQDIQHARQLLPHFFESSRCGDRLDLRARSWWKGEEPEAETVLRGKPARLRRRSPV